jgi:hypothetical protein
MLKKVVRLDRATDTCVFSLQRRLISLWTK